MDVRRAYTDYKKYGKCLEMTCGKLRLLVTTDVGARVIFFGANGGGNLFYEDLADEINLGGEYFDKNFKNGEKWHIYGGHRFWKSPEDYGTYAPDNYPVEIKEIANGAAFISVPEKMTGLQKTIEITFLSESTVQVKHLLKNVSDNEIKASLWGLTVLARGGTARIPLSTQDTGWLPNRNIVLWSYTDLQDERLTVKNDEILLRQDPNIKKPIKIGVGSGIGKIEYTAASGEKFIKTIVPKNIQNCPDFCCNIEAYTSEKMLEAETLSEIAGIVPNATVEHIEIWEYRDEK